MATLQSILSRSLLALSLACGSAFAGPVYHVDVNTNAFSGKGILELIFSSKSGAAPATATLSNFTGSYNQNIDFWGGSTGSRGIGIGMSAPDESGTWEGISLGGLFGFDVSFDGPDGGDDGASFTVALLQLIDDVPVGYLTDNPVAMFDLSPRSPVAYAGSDYASVTEKSAAAVPEPPAAMLVLIGLMMAGAVARRRA